MVSFFGDNKAAADHGRQSLRSGALSVAARAINALIQVAAVIFLARLLSPEDYGLVAMVTAVTGFAPLFVDLGTRDAIVQRPQISKEEISALFWVTLGIGVVFSGLVASAGPWIARLYGEPRLTQIALISSLAFVTSALSCQHYALLRRAMMFQNIAVLEVISNLLAAAAAVGIALAGFGYWALVSRPIINNVLSAIGVWSQCRWLPALPRFTEGVKQMLKFGVQLTGFSLTDFFRRTCDRIAIGYGHGATRLGYYQKAFLVYDNVLDLTIALHAVAGVSLSKLRDNLEELRRLWAKGLSTLSFYAMPIFGAIAVVSQDFIFLVLGAKWNAAGTLLSVLAFRGMPHVVERTLGWLHVAAGTGDRWLRWGLFVAATQVAALFAGLPFGAMGVAVSYTVAMFLIFVPTIVYAGRPFGINAGHVWSAVKAPLLSAVIAAGIGFLARFAFLDDMQKSLRMVILGLIYVGCYLALVLGWFRFWTPLRVMASLLKDYLPSRWISGPKLATAAKE